MLTMLGTNQRRLLVLPQGVITLDLEDGDGDGDGRTLLPFTHPNASVQASLEEKGIVSWHEQPHLATLQAERGEEGLTSRQRRSLYQSLNVTASVDDFPDGLGALLHVSVSTPIAIPSWEEIKAVRYAFFPRDVDAMMMLPRDEQYVNIHPYCMQIILCPERWAG